MQRFYESGNEAKEKVRKVKALGRYLNESSVLSQFTPKHVDHISPLPLERIDESVEFALGAMGDT